MSESDHDINNSKKRKIDILENVEESDAVSPRRFVPGEILKNGRFACVKGELDGQPSLLLLETREFTPSDLLSDAYSGQNLDYEKLFHNDIYSRYILYPKAPYNGVKASIVSPYTQKHLDKYRQNTSFIIQETAERYKNITLKHLLEDQFNIQWVYNILSGKTEADRVIYKGDPESEKDFILLPDLHWDGKDSHSLHLLALPFKRQILSVRDLNAVHLPLLHNIRSKSIDIIREKYNLGPEKLRIYFHYQPTFYHLHVHITYIQHEAPGIFVEKAILLDTVINNIELVSDYYQRATLPFTVRETDSLYAKYKEAGVFEDSCVKINSDNGNSEAVH